MCSPPQDGIALLAQNWYGLVQLPFVGTTHLVKMLATYIVEEFICVRLIEKSAKSWRFALANGEEGVVGQQA